MKKLLGYALMWLSVSTVVAGFAVITYQSWITRSDPMSQLCLSMVFATAVCLTFAAGQSMVGSKQPKRIKK